ncbi:M23 family metallopeptidase [Kribbella sp. NPDC051586]|uniref:M23 family metallopeptidase n=1 Tax=Kribbella sp. NPDC051586 TaxID=3364118 RepID=UPI003788AE49
MTRTPIGQDTLETAGTSRHRQVRGPEFAVVCARLRIPTCAAGLLCIVLGRWALEGSLSTWLAWIGTALLVIGLALYFRVGTLRRAPLNVAAPVTGQWLAMNSPASKTPSHGLHAYGQTYAIDLVYAPADQTRPGMGWWPLARRPAEFPGFGRPVYAPAAGVVARVHDSERDHWSRTSFPGLIYLLVESVREFLGPNKVLGNHVIIELDNGTYALVAHLQRRSATVKRGDTVAAGDVIGACGNSGNSTEPHLHFQVMDHPNILIPAGFTHFTVGDRAQSGMPSTGTSVRIDRHADPADHALGNDSSGRDTPS